MNQFDKIINKTITGVWVDENNLTIETDDSTKHNFTVYGDCCSQSYFHALYGVDKVLGKKIVKAEEIELPAGEIKSRYQECVSVYGYRLSAEPSMTEIKEGIEVETSNSMIIEFRNDSNGYYGGTLDNPEPVDSPKGKLVSNNWEISPLKD